MKNVHTLEEGLLEFIKALRSHNEKDLKKALGLYVSCPNCNQIAEFFEFVPKNPQQKNTLFCRDCSGTLTYK